MLLDLSKNEDDFANVSATGCCFLGCTLSEALAIQIWRQGGSIVNEMGVLPASLPAFTKGMYTVSDLYKNLGDDGSNWEQTPDYDGFKWFMSSPGNARKLNVVEMLATLMHDAIQEREVMTFLEGRKVVAIMGGHDCPRQQSAADIAAGVPDLYWKCVDIAKKLSEKGFMVTTGGGPGLMEAANLGALLAGADDKKVSQVRSILTQHAFGSAEWRATALAARRAILGDAEPAGPQVSIGIPTWFYGHEPPNMFAAFHAKMFYNSLREDGLVSWANSGIVFFEGNGGTVQEVFQDACINYYSAHPTPMVLFNANDCWDRPCDDVYDAATHPKDKRKPLVALLMELAREKKFENLVLITEDAAKTVDFIVDAAARV